MGSHLDSGDVRSMVKALSEVPFLSGASPRALARLALGVSLFALPEDTPIFSQGDMPTDLYVVRSGAVLVRRTARDGSVESERILGPKDLLGEVGILGGHPRTASAKTTEPSELWSIKREAFLDLYSSEPAVAVAVASTLARYVLDDDRVAEDLLGLDVRGRVAKRLLSWDAVEGRRVHHAVASEGMSLDQVIATLTELARTRRPEETVRDLYANVDELALVAGGTRAAVERILFELERGGSIVNTQGNVIILDAPSLATLAKL